MRGLSKYGGAVGAPCSVAIHPMSLAGLAAACCEPALSQEDDLSGDGLECR